MTENSAHPIAVGIILNMTETMIGIVQILAVKSMQLSFVNMRLNFSSETVELISAGLKEKHTIGSLHRNRN